MKLLDISLKYIKKVLKRESLEKGKALKQFTEMAENQSLLNDNMLKGILLIFIQQYFILKQIPIYHKDYIKLIKMAYLYD